MRQCARRCRSRRSRRFGEWRADNTQNIVDTDAVIADYVADRLGFSPDDLMPRMVGHISLALALSSYEQWLPSPGTSLRSMLAAAMASLAEHLDA